ncbi:hypothetical protein H5410_054858 [Solanum commersonii]|uniref:Uncharacterized protein n=1 Tax=Solanum commersonii TaxID=4109 RepID=A0A9J5WHL8_SOLCO|nr:hypothetical protein H5410_054858 [Solanum commersonii]
MARANDVVCGNQQLCVDPLPFARSYQLEALEAALKQNTIVYLETGSGKTLIAIMLLRNNLDWNSLLNMRTGESITYREYYKKRGKRISKVHNYLQRSITQKAKESTDSSIELPPELCLVIMSPVSISTLYTYSFVPSIMHRIESLVMASHLNSMLLDDCKLNVFIPTAKVLEAVTTRKCLEKFHLESLETLGDAFLKYVGYIRNEPFNLHAWIIPGDSSQVHSFNEEFMTSSDKMMMWLRH